MLWWKQIDGAKEEVLSRHLKEGGPWAFHPASIPNTDSHQNKTKTKLLYEVDESTSQKPGSQAKGLHSFFGK